MPPIANQKQITIVAYTAYPWQHAVASLRIVHPLQQAGIRLIQGNQQAQIHPELVSQGDAVLIQREFPAYLPQYEQIVARARAEGKPLIYEIDDLLIEIPQDHPDYGIHYYTPALLPMLRAISEADLVTASTEMLAETLRAFNPNTWSLPNYLDDLTWTRPVNQRPSPTTIQLSANQPSQGGTAVRLIIAYIGSTSHAPDLEAIAPVLARLLERNGDGRDSPQRICFKFYGAEPPSPIRGRPEVEWTPLALNDYARFAEYIYERIAPEQSSTIFIAPLADTFFNNCKSPVKFFEYSALGIPGVYSRLPAYKKVVSHGQNGFLASTPEEWESCLAQLIEDESLRAEMGCKAEESVRASWLLSQHAHEWADLYQQALPARPAQNEVEASASRNEQVRQRVYAHAARQLWDWQTMLGQQKQFEIASAQAQLQEIQNSATWNLARSFQAMRLALAPHGSARERWLMKLTGR